jgi:hypothetical protein
MHANSSCSLQFNTSFGEYALLDEAGELLETGKVRMSKAALWNRFAALPPSVVSVNYDPRFLWAVELLTQIGHAVVFSGAVPELLREELSPVVGTVTGTALLCPSARARTGIFFLVDADKGEILDAHYMVGPVTSETKLGQLASTIPQPAAPGSAQESACRLHQLLATGMMKLPEVAFGLPSTQLKSNAVAAA